MKYLLIITLLATSIFADFTRTNDVVTDQEKHLQWDDKHIVYLDWRSAINYCEDLVMDGKSDWRLPNVIELSSITDFTRSNLTDSTFRTTKYSKYWSSTSKLSEPERAWFVEFTVYGRTGLTGKGQNYYVRCVRTSE